MTLPNFLVIGAGRAGTTSLHHYLGQHPEVYLPKAKAPSHFFCVDLPPVQDPYIRLVVQNYFVPDPEAYEGLFDDVRGERAIGEVSPVYLATTRAAPRIARRLPGVKLVAILRNPVDRVHARFVGRRRDGLERRTDLAEIVRIERRQPLIREDAFGTYLASGFCSHFLQSYLERFPRERIRLYLFEDLVTDAEALVRDLFDFLEVDPDFAVDTTTVHNRSGGTIANPVLRWLWMRSALPRAAVRRYLPQGLRDAVFSLFARKLVADPLSAKLRDELTELYREEILRLQDLLGRDLAHWLAPPAEKTRSEKPPMAAGGKG